MAGRAPHAPLPLALARLLFHVPAFVVAVDRQQHGETGIARHALEGDGTVVLGDEILRDRQPQPAAVVAPGHQGVEDALAYRRGHARAVVDDLHADRMAVTAAGERDLAGDARAQGDLALALQRL